MVYWNNLFSLFFLIGLVFNFLFYFLKGFKIRPRPLLVVAVIIINNRFANHFTNLLTAIDNTL